MLKFILVAFAATVLWMSASNANPARASVICESNHDANVECETGSAVANPQIENEFSNAACTFGSTWGYYGSKIWVNHGCRGEFSFDLPAPAPVPTPSPRPRPPAHRVVDCRWNTQNWQPWYRPDSHFVGLAGFGFQDANPCIYTVQRSRDGAICNWNGTGFTSYDMETNDVVDGVSYASIDSCYAALR